ncbi:CBS domain-containing protein [Radiobacillus kanasensis]|uniref:cyclic-di-AMP-binding protein CbpB n=1 Tax=Radiobacillus kanasensis TaxID=2844358 RepID=UPI001E5DC7DC|nr:cyclic-di-AMP-binding protein CbpB [Radiobacillus kanasensis]UFU00871.1 CBS domain-containing protein [Radiobacillus kanasensis]
MTSTKHSELTDHKVGDLMIPSEKVAHVQLGNPLEHALLVLVKSGYSAVPVLDISYKLQGTISKTAILNSVLGLERFEMEKLSDIKVDHVMNQNVPFLHRDDDFVTSVKSVVDFPFVCVADEEGYFDGILTRRAILKQLNKYIHANRNKPEMES